jgi:hypothetical protein
MSIILEVSLGEALDKLSILEIKKNKIVDERRFNVENEYDYLKKELDNYACKYKYLYKILLKVNTDIWELQDTLRSGKLEKIFFYKICDDILNLNDSRFLVKKKINESENSLFKEQKGYKMRCLNVVLHCDKDMIDIIDSAIRYYSFYYDEIFIFCNDKCVDLLNNYFDDDKFIRVNNIDEYIKNDYDYIIIDNNDIEKNITHSYFMNMDIVINNNNAYSENINKIYEKLNLDVKIIDEYKKIN